MTTSWATFDESTGYTPEKMLHIKGTGHKAGGALTFWMFNPPAVKEAHMRCGICKQGMDGYSSCPNCYPWRQDV